MKKKPMVLEDLLKDGFTRKYAAFYLRACENEKKWKVYDQAYVDWCHSVGFLAEHAYSYGLTEDNYQDYLSCYDYYKCWPVNTWARIWVNDKLTLRHILADADFKGLMPKYYYYTSSELGLMPLSDNVKFHDGTLQGFVKQLLDVGDFACKPNNGTMTEGFCRLSALPDGHYRINDQIVDYAGIATFVHSHPNYVFQEYLKPSREFCQISPLIHTLRITMINDPRLGQKYVGGFFRFSTPSSGTANYFNFDGTNTTDYRIYTDADYSTGRWGNAKILYATGAKDIENNPETNAPLSGVIPNLEKLHSLVDKIMDKLNLVPYMGFDFGITDEGFKLMEINTHPGISSLQIFRPLLKDEAIKEYFTERLHAISALSPSEIIKRNGIPR